MEKICVHKLHIQHELWYHELGHVLNVNESTVYIKQGVSKQKNTLKQGHALLLGLRFAQL